MQNATSLRFLFRYVHYYMVMPSGISRTTERPGAQTGGKGGGIKPTWVEPSLAQPAVGSSLAGSKLQSGLAYTMVVLIVGSHSLLGSSLVVTPCPAASSTRPANMSAGGLALTHQGLFRHTRY